MVNWLFSFHGRINRAQYWFGCLIVGMGGLALAGVLAVTAGAPMSVDFKFEGGAPAPNLAGLLLLPLLAMMTWAGLALQVKRFHDRGRSGWFAALPVAVILVIVVTIASAAAAGAHPGAVIGSASLFIFVLWGINLWFFIELGCLAGVDLANEHGDPPGGGLNFSPLTAAPRSAPAQSSLARAMGANTAPTAAGAEAALERAIAEQKHTPPAPGARAAPSLAPAPAGASFGRRTAR
ncbi:MAG: DUF805 domain-containing protein [Hyphomonadaceae bacterium]